VLGRNIQDKAASTEVPRLARAKRAQHMALVTSTAVTQHASQARGIADMPWGGLCSRIAWSTASIKALTKGAGCAITIAVPLDSRGSGHTLGTVSLVCT
jgi:hypothetical protein